MQDKIASIVDEAYALYPCKKNKKPGMDALKRKIKTVAQAEEFLFGVKNYVAWLKAPPKANEFKPSAKYWGTFVNQETWKEYQTEKRKEVRVC
jgi:hypothetical protein